MSDLFADTSGWASLADPAEPFHALAMVVYRTSRLQSRRVFTTNYAIVELEALLTNHVGLSRPRVISFIEGIEVSPFVTIVHVDEALHRDAWRLLRARHDKEWSVTDCVSFLLMRRRRITEALTSDHHFEQAGFIQLLK